MTLAEMLEANSIPEPNSGCFIWLRGCSNDYPVAWWEGRQQYAHRLALKAKGVDLAADDDACHRCDVSLCVNGDHLFPGSRSVNMEDARAKGRLAKSACGRGHSFADNVYVYPSGKRECLTCKRQRDRLTYLRKRDG